MRSNQRPPGLPRTGRFRPLTEVPHGGARAEGTGRGIEEVLANPTRAVGVARHRFGERQRGALARGEERARGVASHRPELSDREKRLARSEEHTSELQSRLHLVCRLLLEKKKQK